MEHNIESNISYIRNNIRAFSNFHNNQHKTNHLTENITLEIFNRMSSVEINPEFEINHVSEKVVLFSIAEIDIDLHNKKISSRGLDAISYLIFKHIPYRAKLVLLKIYNDILLGNTMQPTGKNSAF